MELTIATINEILLPPFLFLVVFCFLCCQLKRPHYVTATQQPEAEIKPVAFPQPQGSPEAVEEIQIEQEPTIEEAATEDLEDVPVKTDVGESVTTEPIPRPQPELYIQVLAALDELGKREARKVMGGLKLQQKRNGVELSTELMIASIRREFKADPDLVIAVIQERLPELLLSVTNQPEQLASLSTPHPGKYKLELSSGRAWR
jgi:hypothetical protein